MMPALGIEAVAPDLNRDYKRKARPRASRGETPKILKEEIPNQAKSYQEIPVWMLWGGEIVVSGN